MDDLTEKQRRFVEAYCGPAKGVASEAAKIAGYAHAESNAHRLMENDGVSRAIAAFNDEIHDDAIATAHEVQAFLTSTMRGTECRSIVVNDHGIVRDEANNEVTEAPEPKDRVKAAEALAKMRGYFAPAKAEVKVDGAAVVVRFARRRET